MSKKRQYCVVSVVASVAISILTFSIGLPFWAAWIGAALIGALLGRMSVLDSE